MENVLELITQSVFKIVEAVMRSISNFLKNLFSKNPGDDSQKEVKPTKKDYLSMEVCGEDEYSQEFIFKTGLGSARDRGVFARDLEVFKVIVPAKYRVRILKKLDNMLRIRNLMIEIPEAVEELSLVVDGFMNCVKELDGENKLLVKKAKSLRILVLKDTIEHSEKRVA